MKYIASWLVSPDGALYIGRVTFMFYRDYGALGRKRQLNEQDGPAVVAGTVQTGHRYPGNPSNRRSIQGF